MNSLIPGAGVGGRGQLPGGVVSRHFLFVLCPQKLIGRCALPGSCTEKEEAQFLLAVCSRVSQDPHMLRYILQVSSTLHHFLLMGYYITSCCCCFQAPDRLAVSNQSPDAASSQSDASSSSAVQSERGLLWVLLQLSSSQVG